MENKKSILWQLFKATFILSASTFGGGFVIVSLMRKKFVDELNWLEEDEMLDITAISQSSPGPIPVNASIVLGYRMCGVLGSLVALLGTVLPPMVIISVISVFYQQFRENKIISIALQVMRVGVAAVIFDVVFNLAQHVFDSKKIFHITLMFVAFIAIFFFNVSAMMIILSFLAIGIIELLLISKAQSDKTLEKRRV